MEKKAKIIATLGPAIYNETKLKQLVKLGVDAFRINFSHDTKNISSIVKRIRKVERSTDKKIALIADLQGVKLRVGKIKESGTELISNKINHWDLWSAFEQNECSGCKLLGSCRGGCPLDYIKEGENKKEEKKKKAF